MDTCSAARRCVDRRTTKSGFSTILSGAGRRFCVQNPERDPGSFLADFAAVLVDAGEGNTQGIVIVKISAPNNGDVLRNPNSRVQGMIIAPIARGSLKQNTPSGLVFRLNSWRIASAPRCLLSISPRCSVIM